jgi:1,2-diacylglycerol 3-beta-glucosyltransferase
MLLIILAIVSAFYATMILLFAVAAARAQYSTSPDYRPFVSIIIAARNEEANIGRCLGTMAKLTYPHELLEVIVVDDRSTDATASIVQTTAEANSFIRLITAAPEAGHLRGKTNAVTQGIEASRGEVILFTDADCEVPPGWVENTVKYYTDESIGIVAGFTELRASRAFEKMQTLDWYYLFSVAAGTVRMNYPVTAVGNNLSVRRTAYDAVGGYRTIPFSVTEDYALFHAVTASTKFKARFPMDRTTLVHSQACPTLNSLYRQKLRWFTGGRDMDPKSLVIFGFPYLLNLLLVVSPLALPLPAVAAAFGTKIAADIILTLPVLARFNRWTLLRAFPLFELYFFLYVLCYPPLVLFGKRVIWKERSF